MDRSSWLQEQLTSGAAVFTWAIEQIPVERLYLPPPASFNGEWPAARHALHLLVYERDYALPSMRRWLGGPQPGGYDEDALWERERGRDLQTLLRELKAVRAEQIALLVRLGEKALDEVRSTGWGDKPLSWVVTKTLQHTHEHTHDVLTLALFWDEVLAVLARSEDESAA